MIAVAKRELAAARQSAPAAPAGPSNIRAYNQQVIAARDTGKGRLSSLMTDIQTSQRRESVLYAWLERVGLGRALAAMPALVRHAYLFVDFFILLSGFVIAHSLRDGIADAAAFKTFMARRLGRVYPLYAAVLLAFLIQVGRQAEGGESAAFVKAGEKLGLPDLVMPAAAELNIASVNSALDALLALKPLQKPAFLKACAVAICADGVATVQELEMFRTIAIALDCPIPPLPLSRLEGS